MLPFLGYFIKGGTQIAHIRLYYILYLLQTVSSYLLTYRASIIFAHQKQYISNFVTYIFTVVRYLLQIILLAATKKLQPLSACPDYMQRFIQLGNRASGRENVSVY